MLPCSLGPGCRQSILVLGAQPNPVHGGRQRAELRGRVRQQPSQPRAPPRRILRHRRSLWLEQSNMLVLKLRPLDAQPPGSCTERWLEVRLE